MLVEIMPTRRYQYSFMHHANSQMCNALSFMSGLVKRNQVLIETSMTSRRINYFSTIADWAIQLEFSIARLKF